MSRVTTVSASMYKCENMTCGTCVSAHAHVNASQKSQGNVCTCTRVNYRVCDSWGTNCQCCASMLQHVAKCQNLPEKSWILSSSGVYFCDRGSVIATFGLPFRFIDAVISRRHIMIRKVYLRRSCWFPSIVLQALHLYGFLCSKFFSMTERRNDLDCGRLYLRIHHIEFETSARPLKQRVRLAKHHRRMGETCRRKWRKCKFMCIRAFSLQQETGCI